jgi:hypothetical protein
LQKGFIKIKVMTMLESSPVVAATETAEMVPVLSDETWDELSQKLGNVKVTDIVYGFAEFYGSDPKQSIGGALTLDFMYQTESGSEESKSVWVDDDNEPFSRPAIIELGAMAEYQRDKFQSKPAKFLLGRDVTPAYLVWFHNGGFRRQA